MSRLFDLPQAAEHAAQIDRLVLWSLGLVVALLGLWGTAFLVGLWRASRPNRQRRAIPEKLPLMAEAMVVTAEVVLLFGFALPLSRAQLVDYASSGDEFEVRVVAQQYAWNIHYPGPDGVFGRAKPELVDELSNPLGLDPEDSFSADDVTTLNRLRVPEGRQVVVLLSSRDVIHGFALPHFRVQRDAVPGLLAKVRFLPNVSTQAMRTRLNDDEFDYEIACAQLCGLGHSRMRGFVEVMEPAALDSWLAEQQQPEELDSFWR